MIDDDADILDILKQYGFDDEPPTDSVCPPGVLAELQRRLGNHPVYQILPEELRASIEEWCCESVDPRKRDMFNTQTIRGIEAKLQKLSGNTPDIKETLKSKPTEVGDLLTDYFDGMAKLPELINYIASLRTPFL